MQLSSSDIQLITLTSLKSSIIIFLMYVIMTMSEEELCSYKSIIINFILKLKGCVKKDVGNYNRCFKELGMLKDSEELSEGEVLKVQVALSKLKKEKEGFASLLEEGEWEELVCQEIEEENKLLQEDLKKKKKVAVIWLESKLRLDQIKFDQVLSQKTILISKLKIENQSLKYRIDFVKKNSFNSFELI